MKRVRAALNFRVVVHSVPIGVTGKGICVVREELYSITQKVCIGISESWRRCVANFFEEIEDAVAISISS